MRTDKIIDLLVQDLPSRQDSVGKLLRRLWPATAAVAGIAFLVVAGVRNDLTSTGLMPTATKLTFGALLAAVAIMGAVRLSRPEARSEKGVVWLIAVAAFLVLIVGNDVFWQGLEAWRGRLFGKGILPCLTLIPTLAALPLAASLFALRNGATTAPAISGALAGLGSAGLAILGYGLFCNEDSPLFIATWYGLAAVITGVVGAILGPRLLRW